MIYRKYVIKFLKNKYKGFHTYRIVKWSIHNEF